MANWALVIGINNYQRLKSLKYAQHDAELMRDYLSLEANFERVFYFADNAPRIQAPDGSWQDMQPNRGNILSFLHDFFEEPKLNMGDNFWFFFSGHGLRYQGQDYLVPSGGNPRLIKETTIALSTVTQRLRRSGADNVVLLLDACRNENELGNRSALWQKQKGVITIASCSPEEESYEIPSLKQGSFTYALLEALRIEGENNCATVERLYARLRYRVEEINQEYDKPAQTPYAVIEPASKYHLILLPKQANLQDIAQMREDAQEAELEGSLLEAKQLWIRVLAISPTDPKVLKAYERIILKIAQQSVTPPPPSPPKPISKGTSEFITVDKKEQEVKLEENQAQSFTEDLGNYIKLEMIPIRGGKFMMGSPEGEGNDDERPQHEVTVQDFYMGKYPITQAQYQKVMGKNPSDFKGDDQRPVENVSWDDAVEFCKKLSKQTGREYRLPTEAEWEYACRAGTTTPYYFGDEITSDLANYGGNVGETTAVGKYPPNTFSLYDMHGQVWEWCQDDWHDSYSNAPTDGIAWVSGTSSKKVIRGGSWNYSPDFCRSAFRGITSRDYRNSYIGFRVVCVAPLQ
ncbi:MAG: SUMF1/EgtB/PvdO family nonheme iron enzyme [Xenococcus sp. (in: cyanobacteria)]